MSDQDEQFQNLWKFSRVEIEWESLSDDHHSKPSSACDPKIVLETIQFPGTENDQHTMHSPTSHPSVEPENQSTFEEPKLPNRKPNQPGRTVKRNAQTRRTKRPTSDHEPTDAALLALKEHMVSLVEEIKTTGEKLIAWMVSKLKSPSNDNAIVFLKPSWARKGQRNNMRRSKTPRDNPTSRKRKSVAVTKNCEDGSSGSRSPPTEVVALPKEGEDVVMDAMTNKKKEKQKGKASSSSIKKRKSVGPEAVRWTDADHLKLPTALTQKQAENSEIFSLDTVDLSDFSKVNTLNSGVDLRSHQLNTDPRVMQYDQLTLPTALPQKQAESREKMLLESVNLLDFGKISAPNPRLNLNSHQLNTDPRVMRNDAVMAQTGLMNNVNGYEQSTGLEMGNGIGNAFPFPLVPQGSSLEAGVRKVLSPFTVQYLTQRTMVSGMYREPLGFSNGNHVFMGNYLALNQNLNNNAQQDVVVMSLQSQDMTRGASNQGIP